MKIQWTGTFEKVGSDKITELKLIMEGTGEEIDQNIREFVECFEQKGFALIEDCRKRIRERVK